MTLNENKLYGETYEVRCENGCYSIVNNGGTETEPTFCPFCGSSDIELEEITVIR